MAARRSSHRSQSGRSYGNASSLDRAMLALGIKKGLQAAAPDHSLAIAMAVAVDLARDLDGTTRAWFLHFAAKMWDVDAKARAQSKR
jgi:hypothetical protein